MGGAKMEAFRSGELATTTITDADGHYVMRLAPAGTY
jgi:hypothetical protein